MSACPQRTRRTSSSQLPFGWVCFSNVDNYTQFSPPTKSQLPFGWVCFSNHDRFVVRARAETMSQLPFGWVCFSNNLESTVTVLGNGLVSIAFRLGLFL